MYEDRAIYKTNPHVPQEVIRNILSCLSNGYMFHETMRHLQALVSSEIRDTLLTYIIRAGHNNIAATKSVTVPEDRKL